MKRLRCSTKGFRSNWLLLFVILLLLLASQAILFQPSGAVVAIPGPTVEKTLSSSLGHLGDHITVTVVANNPLNEMLTLSDSMPSELKYIPGTFTVDGTAVSPKVRKSTIRTSIPTGVHTIVFDVQVVEVQDVNVTLSNWVYLYNSSGQVIGSDSTDLNLAPYEGFTKIIRRAEIDDQRVNPDFVPVGTDVHWFVNIIVKNIADDDIVTMRDVSIEDKLAGDLELDSWTTTAQIDGADEYGGSILSRETGKTRKAHLSWVDIPDLEDMNSATAELEISTDVNPGGHQQYGDNANTEHELSSGAVLKFTDPETGFQLVARTPPMTVLAIVEPVNQPPIATEISAITLEDGTFDIDVLSECYDVYGDILIVIAVSDPQHGKARIHPDGIIRYIPDRDFSGTDSFTYTIRDSDGNRATGWIGIQLDAFNDDPVAVDDIYVNEYRRSTVNLTATADAYTIDSWPNNNYSTTSVMLAGSKRADYTVPYADSYQSYLTFNLSSIPAEATIETATLQLRYAAEGSPTIEAYEVLEGWSESSITWNEAPEISGACSASAVISTVEGYVEWDITLLVSGWVEGTSGNWGICLKGVTSDEDCYALFGTREAADEWKPRLEVMYTVGDTPLTIPSPGVLTNDYDVEGDTLTVTANSDPSQGSVTQNADGSFVYTPNAGFNGVDSYTYTVSDGNGGFDTGTVFIAASWELCAVFKADKVTVVEGETITFINLTVGDWDWQLSTGARWDFDGDGVIDLILVGYPKEVTANVTYTYYVPGIYTPVLGVYSDSDPTGDLQERIGYIVVEPFVPPDPIDVAPPIDATVATSIYADTEFIYTGTSPIQIGMEESTIDPVTVAVMRGKVMTRDGNPLSGVKITVLDHPEYGLTRSREDGMFDLVVNGGGFLTVTYQKEGFLSAQRQVDVPWQDFVWLPDVILIPLDSQVTTVDFSDPIQVARGNIVTDDDGTRQATLLFTQDTAAEMVLPDGNTQPMSSIDVRATEYTVGDSGPGAMVAELPSTVGYTYCVEFTADEALEAGAVDILFNQPVYAYLEDFIGFPVGSAVPVGYYDKQKGQWIPSENGRVIKVLDITGGMADLDTDGDNVADDTATLTLIGITDTEREHLAGLYSPGQTLWRYPVTHFTPWDCNWPYGPPADAEPPQQQPPERDEKLEDPCSSTGSSTIECQNQVLGEAVEVVGTDFSLHYKSDRVPGRGAANSLEIPLSGDTVPASLERIDLVIGVAGRVFAESYAALPNQTATFVWDGRDAYGRLLQSEHTLIVRIGYVYPAVYDMPVDVESSFGLWSGVSISGGVRARRETFLWQQYETTIGFFDALALGMGGWSLSEHHVWNPHSGVLRLGYGESQSCVGIPNLEDSIITTFAGTGEEGYSGDGGPATEAQLYSPGDTALGLDGSLYFVDLHNIRRVAPDGIITTVAGTGEPGYSGDGGPATEAKLNSPIGLDVGPDGSIYVWDWTNWVIRRISPDGIINTVAGTGERGYSGDGGPATEAQLYSGSELAVGPDGSVYITDMACHRVRRISPNGIIDTFAGTGLIGEPGGYSGDGGPATAAQLSYPSDVDIGPDGSIYIVDKGNCVIRRVTPDGIITTIAGTGEQGYSGDGGPAAAAELYLPSCITVGPDGGFYITEFQQDAIRRVSPDGIIYTAVGTGLAGYSGDGGPATAAQMEDPYGMTVGPDGSLYFSQWRNNVIRRVSNAASQASFAIPSEDGTEFYVFDSAGRHLCTQDALTGAMLYEFSYDDFGRLVTVEDGDGSITTIERYVNGDPAAMAIVGPYGQRTTLILDENDYLETITNPAGEVNTFNCTWDGLLLSRMDPRGNQYTYTYDAEGRLLRAEDPAGGYKELTRTDTENGYEVTLTDAMGYASNYSVEYLPTGEIRYANSFGCCGQEEVLVGTNGSYRTTFHDGTTLDLLLGPDPRFGIQSPQVESMTITTPGGLVAEKTHDMEVSLTDPNDPSSFDAINVTSTINGREYSAVYDAASRTLTEETPMGRQTITVLDPMGRVENVQSPGMAPITFTYDSQGRFESIVRGSGSDQRTITVTYDAEGYLDTVTNSLLQVSDFDYDMAGRVTKQILPDGREIDYTYNANGNLETITPPGQPAHTLNYTAVDLLTNYTPPDVGDGTDGLHYYYNEARQCTQIVNPNGVTIDFGYDSYGRLETVTHHSGQTVITYDPSTGYVDTITSPTADTLSYDYDGYLLTSETWDGSISGSVDCSYDSDYRVYSYSVDGTEVVTYSYDDDSLLIQAGGLNITRDPENGLIDGTTLGMVSDNWTYNGFAQYDTYSVKYDTTELLSQQFFYDQLGRVDWKIETIEGVTVTNNYTYDEASRLTTVERGGAVIADYVYDSNSNRLSHTGPLGTVNGIYDAQDRLNEYGTTTYTYTARGELLTRTADGMTTTYHHDALGRLTGVTFADGTEIEYVIDGEGRRIGKEINGALVQGFLYQDMLRPIAELDGDNDIVSYFVYATGINVPDYMTRDGRTYRIVTDYLGSPRLVVDVETGTIAQRMDYDEFGNVIQDTNPGFQPFGFGGGLYDMGTKLVCLGLRNYDAYTGRWIEKDPLLFWGGSPNLYEYVGSDPINLIDPCGLHIPLYPEGDIWNLALLKLETPAGVEAVGLHWRQTDRGADIGELSYSPESLAREIREALKGKPKPKVIWLVVCYGGKGGPKSYAQELADKLGMKVKSPRVIVHGDYWVDSGGDIVKAKIRTPAVSQWYTAVPGRGR